jgi:hypothetical protein
MEPDDMARFSKAVDSALQRAAMRRRPSLLVAASKTSL